MNLENMIRNMYYRVRIIIFMNYDYKLIYEKFVINRKIGKGYI